MEASLSTRPSDDIHSLRRLLDCTRLLHSTDDLAGLTRIILGIVREEVGFDRGTLFVVDSEKHCIRSCVAEGVADFQITLAMGSGIAGSVALSGETLDITDTAREPRFRSEFSKLLQYETRDIYCMPVVSGTNAVVGVLQLMNRSVPLTGPHKEFLSSICAHLGLALERAWFRHEMAAKNAVEQELLLAREELAHLERLSLIGVLTASMVHEVRSPLSGLLGHAALMRKDPDLTPGLAARLKHIDLSAQDALEVVNNFLSYARKEHAPVQPTPIKAVVKNSLALLRYECRRSRLAVETRIDGALAVLANPGHVQQVIVNLMKNAIDATREAGVPGNLLVIGREMGEMVRVEICDDGPGVAEDARAALFRPFFTTKPATGGTGLGLSVCQRLVEMYAGRIGYTPADTGGSVFWFELPAAAS